MSRTSHALAALTRTLLLGAALAPSGCAIHLVAPTPDPVARAAEAPPQVSALAVVARVSEAELAQWLSHETTKPAHFEQRSELVGGWTLDIRREGTVKASASDDRLCFDVPFVAAGTLAVFGQRLDRTLAARVVACAKPRLRANATLALDEGSVRVTLDTSRIERSSRVLAATLASYLHRVAAPHVRAQLEAVSVPVRERVQAMVAPLHHPIAVGEGACLELRPERLTIGQPVVEGGGVRLPAQLDVRPSVSMPCATPTAGQTRSGADRLVVRASRDLRIEDTRLVLPVTVATTTVTATLDASLRARGRLQFAEGWAEITRSRLDTAGGHVLVRSAVRGELAGKALWIVPWRRSVEGEVLVWGTPEVTEQAISLGQVKLDVRARDDVTALAVAFERDELQRRVGAMVRFDASGLLDRAKAALETLALGVDTGAGRLPITVRQRTLTIERVKADGGQLVAEVVFVGHIVVGQSGPPAGKPRSGRTAPGMADPPNDDRHGTGSAAPPAAQPPTTPSQPERPERPR